jgi:hypothetical protein
LASLATDPVLGLVEIVIGLKLGLLGLTLKYDDARRPLDGGVELTVVVVVTVVDVPFAPWFIVGPLPLTALALPTIP